MLLSQTKQAFSWSAGLRLRSLPKELVTNTAGAVCSLMMMTSLRATCELSTVILVAAVCGLRNAPAQSLVCGCWVQQRTKGPRGAAVYFPDFFFFSFPSKIRFFIDLAACLKPSTPAGNLSWWSVGFFDFSTTRRQPARPPTDLFLFLLVVHGQRSNCIGVSVGISSHKAIIIDPCHTLHKAKENCLSCAAACRKRDASQPNVYRAQVG